MLTSSLLLLTLVVLTTLSWSESDKDFSGSSFLCTCDLMLFIRDDLASGMIFPYKVSCLILSVFECEFTLVRRAQRTTLSVYLTSCSVLLLAPTDVDTVNSLRLDAGQNQYQHPWLTPALCCIQETLPIACLHYGDSVRDRLGGNKQLHSTRLTWEQASIHPLDVDFAVTLDDAVSSPDMITNVDWTYPQLNKVGCQMFLTSLWEFSFRAKFSWL